jgi:hypothetical protein
MSRPGVSLSTCLGHQANRPRSRNVLWQPVANLLLNMSAQAVGCRGTGLNLWKAFWLRTRDQGGIKPTVEALGRMHCVRNRRLPAGTQKLNALQSLAVKAGQSQQDAPRRPSEPVPGRDGASARSREQLLRRPQPHRRRCLRCGQPGYETWRMRLRTRL